MTPDLRNQRSSWNDPLFVAALAFHGAANDQTPDTTTIAKITAKIGLENVTVEFLMMASEHIDELRESQSLIGGSK